jgi:hypothetical protein
MRDSVNPRRSRTSVTFGPARPLPPPATRVDGHNGQQDDRSLGGKTGVAEGESCHDDFGEDGEAG